MLGRNILQSGNAGVPSVPYYDPVLALLPVPPLVGLFAGKLLSIPSQTGVLGGALLSAVGVGHVLFGDPPTRRGPSGGVGGSGGGTTEPWV
jgi:hypothetical protein